MGTIDGTGRLGRPGGRCRGPERRWHVTGARRAHLMWLRLPNERPTTPPNRVCVLDVPAHDPGTAASRSVELRQPGRTARASCTVTQSPPSGRGTMLSVPSCAWVMLLTIA